MKLVWDIETDGLEATRIWCLCASDLDSGIEYRFSDYDDELLGMEKRVDYLRMQSATSVTISSDMTSSSRAADWLETQG